MCSVACHVASCNVRLGVLDAFCGAAFAGRPTLKCRRRFTVSALPTALALELEGRLDVTAVGARRAGVEPLLQRLDERFLLAHQLLECRDGLAQLLNGLALRRDHLLLLPDLALQVGRKIATGTCNAWQPRVVIRCLASSILMPCVASPAWLGGRSHRLQVAAQESHCLHRNVRSNQAC
eukprot:5624587-Pleurochrysis_carterae.AAC.11